MSRVTIAVLMVRALRIGGLRRLWRDAALMSGGLLLFSLLQPERLFYYSGPLAAAGCYTRPFPFAPLAAGMVVQVLDHHRIPGLVRGIPAAFAAWTVFELEGWIA